MALRSSLFVPSLPRTPFVPNSGGIEYCCNAHKYEIQFNRSLRSRFSFLSFLFIFFHSKYETWKEEREEMFTKKKEKLYAKLHRIIFVCSYYIIRFVNCFLKKRMHPVRIFLHFSLFLQSNKIFDPIQVIYSSISIIFPCPAIVQRVSRESEREERKKRKKEVTTVLRAI